MPTNKPKISVAAIDRSIHVLREQRVMLDADLAILYGVPTKRLNEAVKRNISRFPLDFMFELTAEEADSLRSQFATSNEGRGGRRYLPRAFTEQGVAMLSSVLSSDRAIAVNIEIMRAFVKVRQALALSAELARRLAAVEAKLDQHQLETGKTLKDHEHHIRAVFDTLRQLMLEEKAKKPARIGFKLH